MNASKLKTLRGGERKAPLTLAFHFHQTIGEELKTYARAGCCSREFL